MDFIPAAINKSVTSWAVLAGTCYNTNLYLPGLDDSFQVFRASYCNVSYLIPYLIQI